MKHHPTKRLKLQLTVQAWLGSGSMGPRSGSVRAKESPNQLRALELVTFNVIASFIPNIGFDTGQF
jgi:hypothetical protein